MAVIRDPSAVEQPTPRPNLSVVSVPTTSSGGAEGKGLAALGESLGVGTDVLNRAQQEQQERVDNVKVEDAWNRYKGAALDLTSGEKGVLRLQAGDAVNGNILKTAQDGLTSSRKQISDGLDSDLQRERFRQRADATDLTTQASVLHHLDQQTRKYADVVMDGSAATARAQVSAAPDNALVFAQAKDALIGQADAYLKIHGINDPQAIDAYKRKLVDSLWEQRIDGLVYSQPALADALFRQHEKEISDPKLKLRLQATTREASLGVTAVNEASRIIDDFRSRVPPPSITGDLTPVSNGARSLRNNNPGNIERGPTRWQGEVEGSDGRFVTFATMADGLRAMQQNLLTYQTKYGLNTVEGIINRWAPAAENGDAATTNYVATVAAALGVDPRAPIDLKDQATMSTMVQAMARVESGGADVDLGNPGPLAPGEVPSPANRVLAANTSGLPTSRDIAAQLPYVMMRVDRRATELYGNDMGNPDRAAFVKRLTSEIHSKIAADVQQLNAIQRQAQGTLIDAVTGVMPVPADTPPGAVQTSGGGAGRAGTPGMRITSFSQIQESPTLYQAWQMLDPQAKLGIERLMEHNMRVTDKGDEVYYRQLWNRIHLEPGDPRKIDFYKQITDPAVADRLSIPQIRELRAELDRAETPGGRSIVQMRRYADTNVAQYFKTNVMFTAQPERQIAATMRWNEDVGRKVDEYVKAGKDVRPLFMTDTPESVVSPAYLQTYVNSTPAQGVSQGAQAVKDGKQAPLATQPGGPAAVPAPAQPANITTRPELDAWLQTLPPGTSTFRGTDGRTYKVPARAPDLTDLRAPTSEIQQGTWDKRPDGTQKGTGFLGVLRTPDGKQASEYSIGVQINGKETDIPTLVPSLTRAEVEQVLAGKVSDAVVAKARAHAEARIKAGKPVFAQDGEGPAPVMMPPAPPPVTMTETGKIAQAPQEAVPMPRLVSGRQARGRADDNFPTWSDVGRRAGDATEAAVGAVERGTRRAMTGTTEAIARGAEALTPPSDAEKAVSAFRGFITTGRYTQGSAQTIQDAISSGMLTGPELATARRMLGEIRGR